MDFVPRTETKGGGGELPHIPAVYRLHHPVASGVGRVLEASIGIIVVADVDLVLRTEANGGTASHISIAVDR